MSKQVNNIEKMREVLSRIDGHKRAFGYYGHEIRNDYTDQDVTGAWVDFQDHVSSFYPNRGPVGLDTLLNSKEARHYLDSLESSKDFDAVDFLLEVYHAVNGGDR